MKQEKQKTTDSFIRQICNNSTEEEIKQAEANFIRFIKLAEKVNERIQAEKQQKKLENKATM